MLKIHRAKVANDPTVPVWGTGRASRDFLHVDDCARASVLLMQDYNERDIINIGSGSEVTIAHLAAAIATVVGYSGQIEFDYSALEGVPRRVLDTTQLDTLGWKPAIDLLSGLETTYAWFVDHVSSVATSTAVAHT